MDNQSQRGMKTETENIIISLRVGSNDLYYKILRSEDQALVQSIIVDSTRSVRLAQLKNGT